MDDIRRKLALIDKQLAGGDFHRRIIDTCPLLFIVVGLISGILIQSKLNLPIAILFAMLIFACIAAVAIFVQRQFYLNRPHIPAYLALLAFLCLGAIRLTTYTRPAANDISSLVNEKTTLATVRGIIVTEPYINRNQQWDFVKFKFSDPTSNFYMKVTEIKTFEGWAKISGTVWTSVNEPVFELKSGDYIQAYCSLGRFAASSNPGQFDMAGYMANRNIFVTVSIESRDGIEIIQPEKPSLLFKISNFLRQKATYALLDGSMPQEPDVALLQALLLGYRKDIDNETYEAFRRTGLLHIISLSGMHFCILISIIWWLCKIAGLLKPARAIICIAASVIFTVIVPSSAPTLRAAIISITFCISIIFRRRPNPINSLCLAAITLLLFRPCQLFEVDWQLSFAAVLGILIFTEIFAAFFKEKIGEHLFSQQHGSFIRQFVKYFAYKLIMLFSVGFAAWLGGAGIMLYHFHTITPLSVLWTVIVSPLVGAIMLTGFFKIILFYIFPTISGILGIAAASLSELFIIIVKWMAKVDMSQMLIGHINPVLIVLYYVTILFTAFAYFRQNYIKQIIVITSMLAIVVFLGFVKWNTTHHKELVVTCLDVGHGQTILAQLPGGGNILFDAGSMYHTNIGKRIVTPFLDYTGIDKLDAVIISHNDTDHINGIPEIAKHCKIAHVYANNAFFTNIAEDSNSVEGFLNQTLNTRNLMVEQLGENPSFGGKAKIKILWPASPEKLNVKLSDNNKSLVTILEFAGRNILLCSDIEQFAQKEILRLNPDLKVDILIAPHHGSASTLEPIFLEKLAPQILICSCGPEQYQSLTGSPAKKQILANIKQTLFTSIDGAISVSIDKKGNMQATCFKDKISVTQSTDTEMNSD
jgi:competence protein ComEC